MVSPVHFEDYSGTQFERLVFAYHVRADWHDLNLARPIRR